MSVYSFISVYIFFEILLNILLIIFLEILLNSLLFVVLGFGQKR